MYLAAIKVIERFNKCKTDRYNHESIWQKVADYMLPLQNNILADKIDGDSKYPQIYDSTGMNSLELLGGSLHGMLTSPTSFFFGLTSGNLALDQRDSVRKWLQSTVRKMHLVVNNSNFQTEIHEYYLNLVGFGNAPLWMEEDVENVVRFASRHVKEVYPEENSKGVIDIIYRDFKLDARGIYDEFGADNKQYFPDSVVQAYNNGKNEKFEIVQMIYPRKVAYQGYNPRDTPDKDRQEMLTRQPNQRFQWVSQYVLVKDKVSLEIKGYNEFPVVYGRWMKVPGENHGRGCGEKALPDVLTINEMTRITLVGAQKVIDPPIQMPDDGFVMPVITRPSGINYYRAGSPETDRISTIFNDSRVDFGYQAIDRKTQAIKDAFYVNQLQLGTGPQMTATEVDARTSQALRLLAPMLGRQQFEFLAPFVGRLYAIMNRRGQIDPVPQELNNVQIKVQYTSVMAMTQRQSEMTNIQRGLSALAPMTAFDPQVTDIVDATQTARIALGLNNFPQEAIRDQKDIDAMRKQRQEQAAQQAKAAQAEQTANTAATAAKAASVSQPA